MSKTVAMTLPSDVLRAAQELEWKRWTLESTREMLRVRTEALSVAKNEARRANEALAEAEQDLIRIKNSVAFQKMRMASAGTDLLTALKEANLMPDQNRPTVGKEPDHDHDPPSP